MSMPHSCIGPAARIASTTPGAVSGPLAQQTPPSRIRSIVRTRGTATVSSLHAGRRSSSNRIRRDPHRGWARRISATATSTTSAACRDTTTDDATGPPTRRSPPPDTGRDPPMHRRAMHTRSRRNLDDIHAAQHSPDRVQALLDHRQDNQCQSRPPRVRNAPRRHPNPDCRSRPSRTSADGPVSHISRRNTSTCPGAWLHLMLVVSASGDGRQLA